MMDPKIVRRISALAKQKQNAADDLLDFQKMKQVLSDVRSIEIKAWDRRDNFASRTFQPSREQIRMLREMIQQGIDELEAFLSL